VQQNEVLLICDWQGLIGPMPRGSDVSVTQKLFLIA
jgi:hypothetical protein